MIDNLLQIIAPHHCSGCDKSGSLLCHNCKYDIIHEPFEACVACGKTLAQSTGICSLCHIPYDRAWCIGSREDTLERLLNSYKFERAYAAHKIIANLFDGYLPYLPSKSIIVPVPTVASHIRERGYDHMKLIARALSRIRQCEVSYALQRAATTTQRGKVRRQREAQARRAFTVRGELNTEAVYIILDDVVTTGATVKYAARALRDAGATTVWVAALCRQTLD